MAFSYTSAIQNFQPSQTEPLHPVWALAFGLIFTIIAPIIQHIFERQFLKPIFRLCDILFDMWSDFIYAILVKTFMSATKVTENSTDALDSKEGSTDAPESKDNSTKSPTSNSLLEIIKSAKATEISTQELIQKALMEMREKDIFTSANGRFLQFVITLILQVLLCIMVCVCLYRTSK